VHSLNADYGLMEAHQSLMSQFVSVTLRITYSDLFFSFGNVEEYTQILARFLRYMKITLTLKDVVYCDPSETRLDLLEF
jgi:hypothetical protein